MKSSNRIHIWTYTAFIIVSENVIFVIIKGTHTLETTSLVLQHVVMMKMVVILILPRVMESSNVFQQCFGNETFYRQVSGST